MNRSRLKCGGYRIQTKLMYVIRTMWGVKLVDISGMNRGNM